MTFFSTNDAATQISAYVKCDSLAGSGKGIIIVFGYSGGLSSEIGRWETDSIIAQYTLINVSTNPLNNYDSIGIRIVGHADMNPVGWPTGSVRFKVDQLKPLLMCDSIIYDTLSVTIYDTTHSTIYDTVTVVVYDSVSVSDTLIINVNLTGVPPNDINTVKVYPNPTNDHIFIENGNYSLMSNYSLKITTVQGQIVFQSNIDQQQFYIDLNTFRGQGIYLLSIFNPQNQIVAFRKIILQ